jgi:hypothetical protein
MPIAFVSQALGHTNIKTTRIYAQILDNSVIDAMKVIQQKNKLDTGLSLSYDDAVKLLNIRNNSKYWEEEARKVYKKLPSDHQNIIIGKIRDAGKQISLSELYKKLVNYYLSISKIDEAFNRKTG